MMNDELRDKLIEKARKLVPGFDDFQILVMADFAAECVRAERERTAERLIAVYECYDTHANLRALIGELREAK